MTPTIWKRVQELLNAALDLPASDRPAFVKDVCGSNVELRIQIEDLIASYENAGSLFENAIGAGAHYAMAGFNPSSGDRVGVYELVEEIGQGGMGTVYRAIRADDQFQQQVAIKIIRSSFGATPELLNRFRAERQILATLSHSNIGRLLDGGITAAGLPYLVMEFIEGFPIDRFITERGLSIGDRLKLFLPVCAAVQYAHQNLIVHRDIKPANVIVTADGTPKLLDFGIAKLLGPESPGQPIANTRATERMMTPAYASPEQVRGKSISTATDVYSLGALLYELLTGSRPFDFAGKSLSECERIICEVDPRRPSLETSKSNELSGDLDAIVMKALRKEPEQRYSSVEQFSEDIGRYLEGRPVHARSGAWIYRAGKFVRRRRLALSIAAVTAVLIAGSAVAALLEERRAQNALTQSRQQLQTALEMANSSLFEIHDSVATLPGSTGARALIVERAIQSLSRLQQNGGSGTQLRSGLAAAYEKLSDIQYRDGPGNLGASKAAEASAKQALELRQSLAAADPGNAAALQAVAADLVRIGDIHRLILKSSDSVREYREAVLIYERLAAVDSKSPSHRAQLAEARQNLALGLAAVEDGKGALEQIQLALNLRREILAENPNDAAAGRGLEQAWLIRGNLQRDQTGDFPGAVASQMSALELARALAARFPHQNSYRTDVASVLSSLGNSWMTAKDPARALPFYRESLKTVTALAAADPADARSRRSVAIHSTNLGLALQRTGGLAEAEQLYRRSVGIQELLQAQDPESPQHPFDLGFARASLGRALIESGRGNEGRHELELSAGIHETLLRSDPGNSGYRQRLAGIYESLGDERAKQRDWKQARASYLRASELVRGGSTPVSRELERRLTERLAVCNRSMPQ